MEFTNLYKRVKKNENTGKRKYSALQYHVLDQCGETPMYVVASCSNKFEEFLVQSKMDVSF